MLTRLPVDGLHLDISSPLVGATNPKNRREILRDAFYFA
jgi:hypothetical protein